MQYKKLYRLLRCLVCCALILTCIASLQARASFQLNLEPVDPGAWKT